MLDDREAKREAQPVDHGSVADRIMDGIEVRARQQPDDLLGDQQPVRRPRRRVEEDQRRPADAARAA